MTRPDTVVLGLRLATFVPDNGIPAMTVAISHVINTHRRTVELLGQRGGPGPPPVSEGVALGTCEVPSRGYAV